MFLKPQEWYSLPSKVSERTCNASGSTEDQVGSHYQIDYSMRFDGGSVCQNTTAGTQTKATLMALEH